MAALPYMQLFVADYLADTAHLTTVQHGAYLLMIMNYWQRGKPLPAKDEYLAQICRMSLDQWLEIKPVIAEFFTERKGCWTHKRIDKDLLAVTSKSTKASEAGKASAAKRTKNKRSTNVQQTFNERSTDAERVLIYTEAHTDTDAQADEEKKEPAFLNRRDAMTAEGELFARACGCFGEKPDAYSLTDDWRKLLHTIRTDVRLGADKFLEACRNRARAPDVPGKIAVTYFLNKYDFQEKIIEWSQGVPRYGTFRNDKKTSGIRRTDIGDSAPIITVSVGANEAAE